MACRGLGAKVAMARVDGGVLMYVTGVVVKESGLCMVGTAAAVVVVVIVSGSVSSAAA